MRSPVPASERAMASSCSSRCCMRCMPPRSCARRAPAASPVTDPLEVGGLQLQGGHRRAHFVRRAGDATALLLQRVRQALQQAADGLHEGFEFQRDLQLRQPRCGPDRVRSLRDAPGRPPARGCCERPRAPGAPERESAPEVESACAAYRAARSCRAARYAAQCRRGRCRPRGAPARASFGSPQRIVCMPSGKAAIAEAMPCGFASRSSGTTRVSWDGSDPGRCTGCAGKAMWPHARASRRCRRARHRESRWRPAAPTRTTAAPRWRRRAGSPRPVPSSAAIAAKEGRAISRTRIRHVAHAPHGADHLPPQACDAARTRAPPRCCCRSPGSSRRCDLPVRPWTGWSPAGAPALPSARTRERKAGSGLRETPPTATTDRQSGRRPPAPARPSHAFAARRRACGPATP